MRTSNSRQRLIQSNTKRFKISMHSASPGRKSILFAAIVAALCCILLLPTISSGVYAISSTTTAAADGTKVAAAGDIFSGCYEDPNHPEGFRIIRFADTYDTLGRREGTCDGSDTDSAQDWWSLPVWASVSSPPSPPYINTIIIDFSSKGGPTDLQGTWDPQEVGIRWVDGNLWPFVPESHCPSDNFDEVSLVGR